LALTLQPALNLAPAPAPAPPDEFDAARFATLNLLVAEDNLNNQKVIRLLLQRLGIEPDCVANGQQAVAAARTKTYDIIILDLHMPVMDGLEASRAIRALKLAKRPLMVALTANAFQEDHDAAVAAGMDEYLTKPITLTRLRQLLAKLTQAMHGPPEPTAPTSSPEPAPTGPPELPPLIDLRQLETLVDLGWADYLDVLGELIREVPVYLADIRTLIVAGDAPALKRRIHSFRGGLACFGCVAMTTRLAQLETREIVPPAQAAPLQAELEALWEQSLGAIKEWEKSVPSFNG
jgi:CheY-like chemotaxis protein/HPt (histidine-containing phosphotransfer) domain-containing protein